MKKISSSNVSSKDKTIKQLCEYVEKSLKKGKVNTKAFEELKKLGFDISRYSEQVKAVLAAEKQAEITKWADYCEKAARKGEDYVNGYDALARLGAAELIERYKSEAASVRARACRIRG
jgi:hypothetical protein